MEKYDLTKGKMIHHLKRIAIPASMGYLFNTLYNVVDTFYAGKISTQALAGLTVSFPIFFIVIALTSGLGGGLTALSAIALGKNDDHDFHQLSRNGLLLGLLAAMIVTLWSKPIINSLLSLTGATGQAHLEAYNYTKVILWGSLFFIMNGILNGILNAQGDTRTYRNFLIIGFFLNLILDPLLIFGWLGLPKLGTTGVALATVIIQALGMVYLIYRTLKSPIFNYRLFKTTKLALSTCLSLLKQALPSSLNMSTIALGVFVINYFVLFYGQPATLAGYGAAVRIEQLALLPALGLNVAVLTITGQNYGKKNYKNIRTVFKLSLLIGCGIMVLGGLVIYPLAPWLIGLFNKDSEVITAGSQYLRIEVWAFMSYIFLNIIISSMQGFKKPGFAVIIGLYRQILLPVIVFYLLGTVYKLRILGVWWGIVAINWSAVAISLIYYYTQLGQVKEDLLE